MIVDAISSCVEGLTTLVVDVKALLNFSSDIYSRDRDGASYEYSG